MTLMEIIHILLKKVVFLLRFTSPRYFYPLDFHHSICISNILALKNFMSTECKKKKKFTSGPGEKNPDIWPAACKCKFYRTWVIAVFGSAFFDFLSKPALKNGRLCSYLALTSVLGDPKWTARRRGVNATRIEDTFEI